MMTLGTDEDPKKAPCLFLQDDGRFCSVAKVQVTAGLCAKHRGIMINMSNPDLLRYCVRTMTEATYVNDQRKVSVKKDPRYFALIDLCRNHLLESKGYTNQQ